jgi:hypothetical protein
MWCTIAEMLLFAKYPEIAGHDTKAAVCSTPTPWFYCVGYRDNLHTYIIFRGLVANETLGMFMFLTHTVWPYLHGKKRLSAVRCNISDGKKEQIDALKSMTLPDGLSPNAWNLLCAWHIINRGMYRVFGSASQHWQRALEKVFWIWQTMETLSAISDCYEWILNNFLKSKIVQSDMSATHQGLFRTFIDNLWSKRAEWSLAHNIELQAFDCRVNTFTEANFSVLTEKVGVSHSMSASTFVRREDLSVLARHNKLAYAAHRDATRSYSHKESTEWTKRFADAEAVMLPKPLEILKNQIVLGASCARSDRTKAFICTKDDCSICNKYLTVGQKKKLTSATLKIHLLCFTDEQLTKTVRFSNLPSDYVDLLRTIPRPKEWRVVTVNAEGCGFRFLCSCGYGMRHMTCCLHVSLVLQRSSDYTYFGCELENLHVRHTNLYASVDDLKVIERTHNDWQGIFCTDVSINSVEAAFPKTAPDESDGDAPEDVPPSPSHDHGTRHRDKRRAASAEEAAYKAEKIGILKSHFYDVLNIVESASIREDLDRFFQVGLDAVFALKRQLPNLPHRTVTTKARRPAGEVATRRKSVRKTKLQTSEAAAPKAMQRRASSSKQRASAVADGSAQLPIVLQTTSADSSDSSHHAGSSSQSSYVGFAYSDNSISDSQTSDENYD